MATLPAGFTPGLGQSVLDFLNKTGVWQQGQTLGGLLGQKPTGTAGQMPIPSAPSSAAAAAYAKNPFVQTKPPYTQPPKIAPMNFDFQAFVQNQLQNGNALPGMYNSFPNQYVSQAQQQVSPSAFMGMQANPFSSLFGNIATSGLPMMQGLQTQMPQQATAAPQGVPPQMPPDAMAPQASPYMSPTQRWQLRSQRPAFYGRPITRRV